MNNVSNVYYRFLFGNSVCDCANLFFFFAWNHKKFEFKTIEILILVLIGTVAFSAFLILLRLESILIYLKTIQEFGVGK
jgi:hypothetical protein